MKQNLKNRVLAAVLTIVVLAMGHSTALTFIAL